MTWQETKKGSYPPGINRISHWCFIASQPADLFFNTKTLAHWPGTACMHMCVFVCSEHSLLAEALAQYLAAGRGEVIQCSVSRTLFFLTLFSFDFGCGWRAEPRKHPQPAYAHSAVTTVGTQPRVGVRVCVCVRPSLVLSSAMLLCTKPTMLNYLFSAALFAIRKLKEDKKWICWN